VKDRGRGEGQGESKHESDPTNQPQPQPKRRVAKATGASVVLTLADMEGNETFDASNLGSADEVGDAVLFCSGR
jgi:hypothetical protein